jgi:hypothetical protein
MQDPSWWKDVKEAIDILVTCFDVTIFFFVSRIPSNMTSAEDMFSSFRCHIGLFVIITAVDSFASRLSS